MSLVNDFPWQLESNVATSSASTPNNSGVPCSVRHCNVLLPVSSKNKMCETCRGRHRLYAITKRAKRKAEKAAVVGASPDDFEAPNANLEYNESFEKDVLWIPVTVNSEGTTTTSHSDNSFTKSLQSDADTFALPDTWLPNNNNIDPQLFQTSSELAGALIYDTLAATHQEETPISVSPQSHPSTDIQTHPSSPLELPNCLPISPDKPPLVPLRYCSVKGCKTIMAGASFFKMCDPCRIKYRGYASTKRAKWKQEKESEQHSDEGSSHRSGSLQSDNQDLDCPSWEESVGEDGSPESSSMVITRMCSVSHCRQPLPSGHEFRRCDQHRLQNRHHSKLKREREKEVKAHAKSRWEEEAMLAEARLHIVHERAITLEPLFTATPLDLNNREPRPKRVAETVLRSTSRGIKRTNYVCSSKTCHNLLNPEVPWKACDTCREHDRLLRKGNYSCDNSKTSTAVDMDEGNSRCESVPAGEGFSDLTSVGDTRRIEEFSSQAVPNSSSDMQSSKDGLPASTNVDLPNFSFEELMLPEMPDTISPTMHAQPYAASSIETFTSVFQAAVLSQPNPIRFAEPTSTTSTPARRSSTSSTTTTPLPMDSLRGPTDMLESSAVGFEITDEATAEKRKSRKKRSKRADKTEVSKEAIEVTDPSAPKQRILPTTVSPHSVEMNPTQPPFQSPLTPNSSPTILQHPPPPYNSATQTPVFPYFMPSPFAPPYGAPQPPPYFYPHYPYTRPTYYHHYPPPPNHVPLPPPHTQQLHQTSHYPYQYNYSHPYHHSSGYAAPSYASGAYPQLQWSTTMTPQAPPPHSGTDYSVASPNIPTNAVDNSRKRKRHEDREVIDVDLSTPFPESPVLSVKNSRTVMIFPSKKQTFSCVKPTCKRTANAESSICDRCRDKLRRHQVRAKKRFKLEPKISSK